MSGQPPPSRMKGPCWAPSSVRERVDDVAQKERVDRAEEMLGLKDETEVVADHGADALGADVRVGAYGQLGCRQGHEPCDAVGGRAGLARAWAGEQQEVAGRVDDLLLASGEDPSAAVVAGRLVGDPFDRLAQVVGHLQFKRLIGEALGELLGKTALDV